MNPGIIVAKLEIHIRSALLRALPARKIQKIYSAKKNIKKQFCFLIAKHKNF
jgi:hypothetical protein